MTAGFEIIVFHAVGTGGRATEPMIDEGLIDGLADCTASELTDELLGGIFNAGRRPRPLKAAIEAQLLRSAYSHPPSFQPNDLRGKRSAKFVSSRVDPRAVGRSKM